jgi:acetyl esterase/lipase
MKIPPPLPRPVLAILAVLFSAASLRAQPPPPPGVKAIHDVDYVGEGNQRQMIDLYVPDTKAEKPRPLIVFIHGGGWENGSKAGCGVIFNFMKGGAYAGASLNYRLTDQAIWPAQIHDVKAGIRWLRAHATEHNFDPERIGVMGISAGGHLVSLLGVTGGVKELEGTLGAHAGTDSRVQCVIDFCGPSDFLTFGSQGSTSNVDDPKSAPGKLLGGGVKDKQDTARAVSPVTYITKDDAPFLIVHGDKDNLVPLDQAHEFREALGKAGVPAALITGKGGGHVFFTKDLFDRMQDFLDARLLGKAVQVADGEVTVK